MHGEGTIATLYAECLRLLVRPDWTIAEKGRSSLPPEWLMQAVWQHQRLCSHRLRTTQGQPLTIVHPGFYNSESGPDFRGAVLQIGSEELVRGDVEIEREVSGWTAHRHAQDPRYRQVILCVVWQAPSRPGSKVSIPILPIAEALDSPLDQLMTELAPLRVQRGEDFSSGLCMEPFLALSKDERLAWLREAARRRLLCKALRLEQRAREVGWEQAFWEGLFTALGYRNNTWPMRYLATLRTALLEDRPSLPHLQARLLGIAGLLPTDLSPQQAACHPQVRRVWDLWWREQERWRLYLLPKGIWMMDHVRPSNHPQRRLALAAHWLLRRDLPRRMERWLAQATGSIPDRLRQFSELLEPEADPFWETHATLLSAVGSKPMHLCGTNRRNDLAVNIILPWLWARTRRAADPSLQKRVEELYFHWPAGADNHRLRLARHRLIGKSRFYRPVRAWHQQALLQWLQDFCERYGPSCKDCPLPEAFRLWKDRPVAGNH